MVLTVRRFSSVLKAVLAISVDGTLFFSHSDMSSEPEYEWRFRPSSSENWLTETCDSRRRTNDDEEEYGFRLDLSGLPINRTQMGQLVEALNESSHLTEIKLNE